MMRCIVAKLDDESRDPDLTTTRTDRRYLRKYTEQLSEPQRTVFLARQEGMTPLEIGKEMGMEREAVCRVLAQTYAGLRVALSRLET